MKFRALEDLPDGTFAGRIVDLTPEAGAVLQLVHAVEPVDEDTPLTTTAATPRRRRYQRRDLEAADS